MVPTTATCTSSHVAFTSLDVVMAWPWVGSRMLSKGAVSSVTMKDQLADEALPPESATVSPHVVGVRRKAGGIFAAEGEARGTHVQPAGEALVVVLVEGARLADGIRCRVPLRVVRAVEGEDEGGEVDSRLIRVEGRDQGVAALELDGRRLIHGILGVDVGRTRIDAEDPRRPSTC